MRSSKAATGRKTEVVTVRREFSHLEANRALVLVRRIIHDVVKGYQGVLDYQEILELAQSRGTRDRADCLHRDLLGLIERLQDYSEELLEIGVELKDWGEGHVDFPAVVGGRKVMLCWRNGEQFVNHWHHLDAPCESRQPLSPEPAAAGR